MNWIRAWHIIFMVTWFAGLFYLPRLFVYHVDAKDSVSHERFVVMERKLFILMTLGAVLTLVFGLTLLTNFSFPWPTWLGAKLVLVLALLGFHGLCYKLLDDFRRQKNRHSAVFFRWFNEVPALFLVGIILLAVAKPFSHA